MLKSLNGRFIIWEGVIVYIFLSCTPIAKKSFNYSSELEALSRLDLLPEFRSNCIVEQISSYDKTGGNDDGFNGTYSYIRKENNKLVIADLKGPGIINRIWTPTPTNGKRLLNYILCIRFFIEVHSIVSASRFFHMPTYLRVVIECQSRFFPFFPAFSRNCPDYFLHTSGSSSFRSLSDLGAR